jgi:parvulin-like peptidyl-prolyl isomerase
MKFGFRGIAFILAGCFIAIATGCSKKDKNNDKLSVAFNDSTVVAMINDTYIYKNDLKDAMFQIRQQLRITNQSVEMDSVVKAQALEWLIANQLLHDDVKNHVIEIKQTEIDDAITQVKRTFPTEADFAAALLEQKMTQREFEQNLILELKVQKMLEELIINKVETISSKDAEDYYNKNINEFTKNEQVHARHVFVQADEKASPDKIKAAQAKIKVALEHLKKGEDFIEVAKTYSDGAAAAKGGDLGFFARGDMVKSFEDKVFSLKVGQISDILQTPLGFHIIKLEEVRGSQKIPFAEVEKEILLQLKQKAYKDMFEEYVNKLKKNAKIKVKDKV